MDYAHTETSTRYHQPSGRPVRTARPTRGDGPFLWLRARVCAGLLVVCTIPILTGCPTSTAGRCELRLTMSPPDTTRPGIETLLPPVSLDPAEYTVSGLGPDGETFEIVTTDSSGNVDGLVPGAWLVSVSAANIDGVVIADASVDIELETPTTAVSITLDLASGTGSVSLSVGFSTDASGIVSVEATALDGSDVETPLSIGGSGDGSFLVTGALASGSYLIELAARDTSGNIVAGGADVVYVFPDLVTSGSITLVCPPPPSAAIELEVAESFSPGVQVSISTVPAAPCFVGEPIDLSVIIEVSDSQIDLDELYPTCMFSEPSIRWYVDGLLESTGDKLSAFTPGHPGFSRIDAVLASSADWVAAGTREIEIIDPVLFGAWRYLEAFVDGENGVNALSGARDCAVHPAGLAVYVAGYDEDRIAVCIVDSTTGRLGYYGAVESISGVPLDGVRALAVDPDGTTLIAACGTDRLNCYPLSVAGIPAGAIPDETDSPVPPPAPPPDSEITVCLCASVGVPVDGLSDIVFPAEIVAGSTVGYAVATASNHLAVIERDSDTGVYRCAGAFELAGVPGIPDTVEPIALALVPDGSLIAISGASSDTVVILAPDLPGTPPTPVAGFSDGVSGVDGLNGGGGLCFSKDGVDLYTAGYYDSAVAHFRNDPADTPDPGWRFVEMVEDDGVMGLRYPRDVIAAPDGSFLVVAASGDDACSFLDRDTVSGAIGWNCSAFDGTGRIAGLDGARSLSLNPVTGSVYIAASNSDALVEFQSTAH